MKLFTCTDHAHHYPVGVSSVVVAEDSRQARLLLNKELKAHGLTISKKDRYTLNEVPLDKAKAIVLQNGDY